MIEIIQDKIATVNSNNERINITREFLQNLVLKILSDQDAFLGISFLGGTALRVLFGLKRYSEDLDFSLHDKSKYLFLDILKKLKKELELMNFQLEIKYKEKTIDSCFISFIDILQLLKLNIVKEQKLSIKLEIDTNPPQGYKLQASILQNEFMFPVRHYDLPSLMSGKLHAVLFRKFIKGRDYYDLLWYLNQNITPNFCLLNNSIKQTEKSHKIVNENNWQKLLKDNLKDQDFIKIQKDVERFLIYPQEKKLISWENFKKILT